MDKNKFYLQFVVKNNNEKITKDNMYEAFIIPSSFNVNGKFTSGGAGAKHEIIDDNTIRILKDIDISRENLPNKMNIDINIDELFGREGNWNISFYVDKSKQEAESRIINIDKTFKVEGNDIKVDKLQISPLSAALMGEGAVGNGEGQISFIAFDDKGREITWDGGSGEGKSGLFGKYRFTWNQDYVLDKDVNNITFIPVLTKMTANPDESDPFKFKNIGVEDFNISAFKSRIVNIDEKRAIEIIECNMDGEFLIVKYNNLYEGKKYKYTLAKSSIYVESNGNELKEDVEVLDKLLEKYNSKDCEVQAIKIGEAKNLKMGIKYSDRSYILDNEKFTVNIK